MKGRGGFKDFHNLFDKEALCGKTLLNISLSDGFKLTLKLVEAPRVRLGVVLDLSSRL